jgi:hypothetical protein
MIVDVIVIVLLVGQLLFLWQIDHRLRHAAIAVAPLIERALSEKARP